MLRAARTARMTTPGPLHHCSRDGVRARKRRPRCHRHRVRHRDQGAKGSRRRFRHAVRDVASRRRTRQAATSTPTVPVPPVSLSEAETAYRDKRYSDATKLFSTYADQHPNNPWGHYMLGLSAWKSGELDLAESAFVRSRSSSTRST